MKVKIAEFNTASTFGEDKKSDWLRSAKLLEELHADVIGCEEVTVHEDFVPDLDMPALYGDYLKMPAIFGKANSRDNVGDYGLMTLSKYPSKLVDKIDLPTPPGYEQRICLIVKIEAETPFYFLVAHFCTGTEYPDAQKNRMEAIRMITEKVEKEHLTPAVFCGDFNATPETEEIQYLHSLWDVCNNFIPWTATHHSGATLDYICTYPKGAVKLLDFRVGPWTIASDHCPLTAELEF